jgi:hypothetical protein
MKLKIVIILVVIAGMLGGKVEAQNFLTNGLVAYYPFDGNANDASGNGTNATVVNAVLCSDRFGYTNQAYLFNGTNSWLQTTNFWPVTGTNAVTVSCWIYYEGGIPQPYAESTMVNWGGNVIFGSRFEFRLLDNSGLNIPGIATLSLDGCGSGSTALASIYGCVWTHLVAVKPLAGGLNDTVFYVNGVRVPIVQQSDNSYIFDIVTNDSLTIGRGDSATPERVFNGAIDDVRIYNRALSSNEVAQLYQIESAQFVTLNKAVWLSFSNLRNGTNYQVQVSIDLNGPFTNFGSPFTPTNVTMNYPTYWNVGDWNQLFFRLQALP